MRITIVMGAPLKMKSAKARKAIEMADNIKDEVKKRDKKAKKSVPKKKSKTNKAGK